MAFSKYVITSAGRNLLLACMASGDFHIEKLVLGSGRYTGLMTEIQDVVAPEAEFSGASLSVAERNGQLEITARLTNEQMEQGFAWREYGVYATDGEKTVLYCYDNAGEEPVPITASSTGAGISNTIKVILNVDSAATVNVSFEPMPEITLDNAVTADGANAVTGAAIYAFVEAAVPKQVPASNVTAGTLAGQVQANADATAIVNVAQLRNISAGMEDLTAGSSALADGEVYLVYE